VNHSLKVRPPFFDHLLDGKNFEVRRDDRGFQKGDVLRLREYDPRGTHDECDDATCDTKRYTGREIIVTVGYVYRGGFGCDLGGFVVLALAPAEPPRRTRRRGRPLEEPKDD